MVGSTLAKATHDTTLIQRTIRCHGGYQRFAKEQFRGFDDNFDFPTRLTYIPNAT
jgi:hypothetical protein